MEAPETSLMIAICDQGVEPDVMPVLEAFGIKHYTKISDVSGVGETGRREGNAVWPGQNTVLLMAMPSEKVDPLIERLHAVRDSYPLTPGMRFIVVPARLV